MAYIRGGGIGLSLYDFVQRMTDRNAGRDLININRSK
jgi:hypothetical protein